MAIHHSDTAVDNNATLPAVAATRRHVTSPRHRAWSSQSAGAGMIIASAVALTAPTVNTTSAMSAGCRHRPRRAASTVHPTIHPSPAQGSSSTDVRDTYAKMYGDSWYTSAATSAASGLRPTTRAIQRTPSPAAISSVAIHSR